MCLSRVVAAEGFVGEVCGEEDCSHGADRGFSTDYIEVQTDNVMTMRYSRN